MFKFFKVIHIIGVAMFLGSIFAHIATGLVPGAAGNPPAMVFARQAIELATRYVTVPGLAIAIVSGALMVASGYSGFIKRRWLVLHMAAVAAVAAITVTVMLPAGHSLVAAANAVVAGTMTPEAFAASAMREHLFGAVNIFLALAAIVLGVAKPHLRRGQSYTAGRNC
ncbi:MAG: DUF2269 family protein [Rhodomicrobium sp.]